VKLLRGIRESLRLFPMIHSLGIESAPRG
jgi:hypothetical protein